MSNIETPAWASKYLDDFETRMKMLETPPHKADSSKTTEDDFINLMREINAGGKADLAEDRKTDEDEFISVLADMNRLTDEGQGEQ